jgi:hypothetical protein
MFRFQSLRRFRPGKLQEAGIPTVPTNIKQKNPTNNNNNSNVVPSSSSASTSFSSSSPTSPTAIKNDLSASNNNNNVANSNNNDDASRRKKKKTSARLRPRFENLQYMLASALVALSTIALQHFVRKGWDKFKGNRTERDLMAILAEKLEVRQDWSVALLYSAVRQADRKMFLNSAVSAEIPEQKSQDKKKKSGEVDKNEDSTTTTQKKIPPQNERFGAPFLADPQFDEQIDFIDGFLTKLRNETFPTISMADMWVAATLTALRSLGGPSLPIAFGRGKSALDDNLYNPSEKSYHVAPPLPDQMSCVEFSEKYVANGFSTPEIVALQGVRSLACHGDSSKEQMARLIATVESREKNGAPVELPPAPSEVWGATSCGVLNFFFFSNLLEGQWEEKTKSAIRLVAEGSGNSSTGVGSSLTSAVSSWWSSLFSSSTNSSGSNIKKKSDASSSGSAVVDVGNEANSDLAKYVPKKMVVTYYQDATRPALCMEPRDLELLEDAYYAGWVHKFGQNEAEFLRVFGEALTKTTQLGWRDTIFNEVPWW